MEFNFDSNEHRGASKTPSIKVINYLKLPSGEEVAGLWMSSESFELCGWKEDPEYCSSDQAYFLDHSIITKDVDDGGNKVIVPGKVIMNPRMLIVQRSPLLKMNKNGSIVAEWKKGDKSDKYLCERYSCVRRYMVIFVGPNNNPLHEEPVQLTARGYFQMEFDKSLVKFRRSMVEAYNKSIKKNATSMSDAWYSMCVFEPFFKSILKGPSPEKQSRACITYDFLQPTLKSWEALCVGRQPVAQLIYQKFLNTKDWWKSSIKTVSDQEKPGSEDDETSVEDLEKLEIIDD